MKKLSNSFTPVFFLFLAGCGTTQLLRVPQVLDPPHIPMHIGVYISPDVRYQKETIGIIQFDVGQILEEVVTEQTRRVFRSVKRIDRYPWQPSDVDDLDAILVIDQPSEVRGWISGLSQWTAEGTAMFRFYSPDNQILVQSSETNYALLNIGPLGGNALVKEVSRQGQIMVARAVVSQFLNKIASANMVLASIKQRESKSPTTKQLSSAPMVVRTRPSAPSGFSQSWAVVVGISNYQHQSDNGLSNLIFADDDARAFARTLRTLGWSDSHIKLLVNEEATHRNIMIALESWLTKAGPNDQVVLFWAGHGYPDPENPEKVYFATYDTEIAIAATGYRMDKVRSALEELGAKNVIMLADTCHAGKLITRGTQGGRSLSIIPQLEKMQRDQQIPKGWIFMVGADTDRQAIEHSSWSNGAFTHSLLLGLSGEADGFQSAGARDGIVTMGELKDYMKTAMPDETQRVLGVAKHPVIATSTGDPDIWNLTLQTGP